MSETSQSLMLSHNVLRKGNATKVKYAGQGFTEYDHFNVSIRIPGKCNSGQLELRATLLTNVFCLSMTSKRTPL
ncbi:hypothetical protein FKM82_014506 [Ascaphus truei]